MDFIAKDGQIYTISKMENNSSHKKEALKIINENWEHVDESLMKDYFENKYSWDGIPVNFIVEKEGNLVGNCSLLRNDFPHRSDIFPWFGNCFVNENHRRKGIMNFMQEYACDYARILGFKIIYLWTKDKALYENLGWMYLEDINLNLFEKVHLFCKKL